MILFPTVVCGAVVDLCLYKLISLAPDPVINGCDMIPHIDGVCKFHIWTEGDLRPEL